MKKIILLSMIASTMIMAGDIYAEYTLGTQKLGHETDIFKYQPSSDLLGGDETYNKLSIGLQVEEGEHMGSRFGLYVAKYDEDSSVGLDFTIKRGLFYFGGIAGIGGRSDAGDVVPVSTSIDTVTYITQADLTPFLTPTTAEFTDDTSFLQYGFSVGVEYDITDDASVKIGYQYLRRQYDISYVLASAPIVDNNIQATQGYNGIEASFKYRF